MIHAIILPLFGLLGIYYTICTLLSLTSNKFLLILLTIITVFLQITFIDIILPYPINFFTKLIFTQYLFPLVNNFYFDSYKIYIMLPNSFILSLQQRSIRSTTHDVAPFLHNLIYQYTNPLSLETEAHSIHTIPLLREHLEAYLYYFRYKTLEITPYHNNHFKSFSTQYKVLIVQHSIELFILVI